MFGKCLVPEEPILHEVKLPRIDSSNVERIVIDLNSVVANPRFSDSIRFHLVDLDLVPYSWANDLKAAEVLDALPIRRTQPFSKLPDLFYVSQLHLQDGIGVVDRRELVQYLLADGEEIWYRA